MSGFEIAGIALAGPAVVVQLIKTSVDGYRFFQETKLVGEEYQQLKLEVDIQKERYLAWIRKLSNRGGDLSKLIDPTTRQYELVLTILAMLVSLFAEVDQFNHRYDRTETKKVSEPSTAASSIAERPQKKVQNHVIRKSLGSAKLKFNRLWKNEATGPTLGNSSPLIDNCASETGQTDGPKALTRQDIGVVLEQELLPSAAKDDLDDLETRLRSLGETELTFRVPGLENRATQLATMAQQYQNALPIPQKYRWKLNDKEQLERFIRDLTKYVNHLHILTNDEFKKNKSIDTPIPWKEFSVPITLPFARLSPFYGREDILSEILETLKPEEGRQQLQSRKTIALHGMGGLGKSQIALEYAYRHAELYSTILWVDATNWNTINDSCTQILTAIIAHYAKKYRAKPKHMFANIAIDLKIPGQIDNTGQLSEDVQKSPWQVVRNWLAKNDNNCQWLLIADGLNDEEDSERLREVLPTGSQGHIIITSRVTLPDCTIIDIPLMDKDSGIRLMLGNKFDSASDAVKETVEKIVDLLGNLPLALAQAVAYINMRILDFSRYLERLKKDLDSLIDQIAPGYKNGVFSNWRLAVKALKKHHPDCVPLLRLCSFLSPHGVSEKLLAQGIETMPWLQNNQTRLDDAIDNLVKYGLAKRISTTPTSSSTAAVDSIWIHHLVQRWARNAIKNNEPIVDKLSPEDLQILHQNGLQDAIRLVGCSVACSDSDPGSDGWIYERENQVQLELCCTDYIPKCDFEGQATSAEQLGHLGRAIRKLADWKNRQGEYSTCFDLVKKATKILETAIVLDPDWESELLLVKRDEIELYAHARIKPDFDVPEYIMELHKRQEVVLGKNDRITLFSRALLGLYLIRAWKPLEARDILIDVLTKMEGVIPEEDVFHRVTISHLAASYLVLEDFEIALKQYTKSHTLHLKVKGGNLNTHLNIISLQNVGYCKLQLRDLEGGFGCFEEAIRASEVTYGPAHQKTIGYLYSLYEEYLGFNWIDKADVLLRKIEEAEDLRDGKSVS
ncbi:hypothetical protein TWF718_009918 [Orbilia javanica]|uniref:Prion-inhibition and propagation HeLo domain-containing protein n=1 Tax=Orbilia javanica TaxID=47235 RepID=A0AAN8RG70_9PEZI